MFSLFRFLNLFRIDTEDTERDSKEVSKKEIKSVRLIRFEKCLTTINELLLSTVASRLTRAFCPCVLLFACSHSSSVLLALFFLFILVSFIIYE